MSHEDPAWVAQEVPDQKPETPFDEPSDFRLTGHPVPLVFTGQVADYFRIWIVCQLLTLLSFGLYAPWARLRKQQYLAQCWFLDGQSFQIDFNPVAKLKGRLVVYGVLLTGLILGLLYPYAQPLLIALAFLPAPWLLSQSNRFNWQSMRLNARHGAVSFSFWGNARILKQPLWILGAGLAAMAISFSVYGQNLKGWQLLIYSALLLFVFFWLYPKATSRLIFQKFAHAKLGKRRFTLQTNPKEIHSNMNKGFMSGGLFIFMMVITAIQIFAAFVITQPDLRALIVGLSYLMLTVCGVSFARARRLNFILNRLNVAGLSFRSALPPFGQAWRSSLYAALGVCTLGASIPWSTVQYSRWRAGHFQVNLEGDWAQFAGVLSGVQGGALDELAQQFEIDLGL